MIFILLNSDRLPANVFDAMLLVMALSALAIAVHLVIAQLRAGRRLHRLDHLSSKLKQAPEAIAILERQLASLERHVDSLPDSQAMATELKVLQGLMSNLQNQHLQYSGPDPAPGAAEAVLENLRSPEVQPPALRPNAARDAMASDALDDQAVLAALHSALQNDRVELYLQPIVNLPQREHLFFECLSRIPTENGDLLVPQRYIQLATDQGLVSAIDNLLLFRLVQLVRSAQRDHLNIGFFCNISDATMRDTGFFQDFITFLAANPSLSNNLIFEFEQAVIDADDFETRINIQRLTQLGFRLSLDRVTHFDFDVDDLAAQKFKFIKIDAHMLHEFSAGGTAPAIVKTMHSDFRRSNIEMIAEKIETEEMLADLLRLGITVGQGYLFGEPRRSRSSTDD